MKPIQKQNLKGNLKPNLKIAPHHLAREKPLYLSAVQAARCAGVSDRTIYQHIADKKLRSRKRSNVHRIAWTDLTALYPDALHPSELDSEDGPPEQVVPRATPEAQVHPGDEAGPGAALLEYLIRLPIDWEREGVIRLIEPNGELFGRLVSLAWWNQYDAEVSSSIRAPQQRAEPPEAEQTAREEAWDILRRMRDRNI